MVDKEIERILKRFEKIKNIKPDKYLKMLIKMEEMRVIENEDEEEAPPEVYERKRILTILGENKKKEIENLMKDLYISDRNFECLLKNMREIRQQQKEDTHDFLFERETPPPNKFLFDCDFQTFYIPPDNIIDHNEAVKIYRRHNIYRWDDVYYENFEDLDEQQQRAKDKRDEIQQETKDIYLSLFI